MGRRRTSGAQEHVGDVKLSSLERNRHSYRSLHCAKRPVASDAERMMDGIFVGHHERTDASVFFPERGLLRGTWVQRKTADQQWDNEFIRNAHCRRLQPEARPPPVLAVVMPSPEASVRAPQQRRRYILKQHVARMDRRQDVRLA